MFGHIAGKKSTVILKNPNFSVIAALILCLVFIYSFWPWREWIFIDSAWYWFAWLSSLDNLAIFELKYHFTGSLFIIPIIYATIVFKWRGALVVSFLSLAYAVLAVGLWSTLDSIVTN